MATTPSLLPIVFLDVDGPLLPFGGDRPAPEPCSDDGHPLLSRLDRGLGRLLAALPAELVWATSWMGEANEVIAPRLGLPVLPVVDGPGGDPPGAPAGVHWKTSCLVGWAAGRPFVWIDDEITAWDEWWVEAAHPGRAMLHRVDAQVGLTAEDVVTIRAWLEGL